LGLVSYNGSTHNNILLEQSSVERSVFIDPHAPAAERYKMIGQQPNVQMGTSPDGVHWTQHSQVVLNTSMDTQKAAFWDDRIGKYVIQLREVLNADTTNPNNLPHPFVTPIASNPPVVAPTLYRAQRLLARVEVDDIMQPWPTDRIRVVMAADESDPSQSDMYHPGGVYKYPYADDAYFMFPWLYNRTPTDDTVYSQFAASRNGANWMRYDRQPYIGLGGPGDPDESMAEANGSFFRNGDYLYQYYMGWPWKHQYYKFLPPEVQNDPANWGKGYYGLVKQRLDGFVSADAPESGGSLETPMITFEGDRLVLNIDASAGSALVALVDAEGNPLPGFGFGDCDPISTNSVDYTVTWNGQSDLSALTGTPVGLSFDMQSAKLYAFQFQAPEPPAAIILLMAVTALAAYNCRRRKRFGDLGFRDVGSDVTAQNGAEARTRP
jgi:hypothetical protein